MRLSSRIKSIIISGIITGIITLFFLIILLPITNPRIKRKFLSNDGSWNKDIALKDIRPVVETNNNLKENANMETTFTDSSGIDNNIEELIDYYHIIIGSFSTLLQAQQNAEKLTNTLNIKIIVLPQSEEGYYRISCGKYFSREDADAAIDSVRKNFISNAWILSVKE